MLDADHLLLRPMYVLAKKLPHEISDFFGIPEAEVRNFIEMVFQPLWLENLLHTSG